MFSHLPLGITPERFNAVDVIIVLNKFLGVVDAVMLVT
jgi:hypothetical protein